MLTLPTNLRGLNYRWLLIPIYILPLFFSTSHAQLNDPFNILELRKSDVISSKNIFEKEKTLIVGKQSKGIRHFYFNPKTIKNIKDNYTALITNKIPLELNKSREFLYVEYDFFAPDFEVNLISDGNRHSIDIDRGIHLKGKDASDTQSFSSLSLFEGEVYGMAYTGDGYRINIMPSETGNLLNNSCVITDENKIEFNEYQTGCVTDDFRHDMGYSSQIETRSGDNCKTIGISVDVDYDLFLKFKGNIQSISNYVTGLFNNVHTLYKRENISISLVQINIHISKDYFNHISASSDLENFRKKYINKNKTVKILLSGYTKSNQATLGGMAYIGTLCLNGYSYAYANVAGTFLNTPTYSWDVFLVTHELGHVMGSKHTHACAWGPTKNSAIDNCAKLEGSCTSAPRPAKGTIMSYCYLSGMPGIDLMMGFGQEPGDLIRQKINSSSCLGSELPIVKTLDRNNTIIEANTECTDGSFTHYYFDNLTADPLDDILIVSIAKNGNDIGKLSDASLKIKLITTKNYGLKKANLITAAYTDKSKPWYVANKYWDISSSRKPIKPIDIRYYYHSKDFTDLKTSAGNIKNSDIKLFNILPPADPNPETNHANAKIQNYIQYSSGTQKQLNKYVLTNPELNLYLMELNTMDLASTGFGANLNSSSFVGFKDLQVLHVDDNMNIEFKTTKEINCKQFIVEVSNDKLRFDSIGKIQAFGNTLVPTQYKLLSDHNLNSELYFRIKATSINNDVHYSPLFNMSNLQNNEMKIHPNPVLNNFLNVSYENNSEESSAELSIVDIYGRLLKTSIIKLNPGINNFKINVSELIDGMHFISIKCIADIQKTGFTVNH